MTRTLRAPQPMSLSRGLAARSRLAVRALGLLLAAAVLAQILHDSNLLGGRHLDGLFDEWIYNGTEVGASLLVLSRALLIARERPAWLLLALGIAGFAAGDVYYTLVLEHMDNPPTPSPADAGYLLLYPCAYAMIVRLVGSHVRGLHTSAWLDGAIAALALAAVGAALVLEPVIHATHGDAAAVATNLAYPLGDIVLVMLVVGVWALSGWRPGGTWLLIALGFALMAVADSVYLFRVAEGTYQAGTVFDAIWPAGLVTLALAAWARPREQHEEGMLGAASEAGLSPRSRFAVTLLPCVFAALALFLLIRADFVHLGVIPEVLAATTLLVAGWRFALTFGDVLELSALRERQAGTDDLTGLPNRRSFYRALNDAIAWSQARGASFALLMIDLDRFKELNDTLGHYAGDLLLTQMGPRMQATLRGEPLARLGGDEFALILRDAKAARVVAERLHDVLRAPFALEEVAVSVHASIGIALYPQDAGGAQELMRRADLAMYQAKEARSRYAFYAPGSDTNSHERLALLAELRDALAQGGLVVHYQPVMDLDSGTVAGVEALARWQHPRCGLLEAEQFIDLVEQAGVMRELTALVLEQSLAQQRYWYSQGHELTLSVNISAISLLDAAFLPELRRQLKRHGTPPGSLRLEIGESMLIEQGGRVHHVLEALCELGVRLALDDFGTGYAPLTHLLEMPVSELKVDGAFIEAMMHDEATLTVVSGTVVLARQLGLALVAEGVETAAQLAQLRAIGCPHAQGYLLCRPLGARALGDWLAAGGFEAEAGAFDPGEESPAQTNGTRLARRALRGTLVGPRPLRAATFEGRRAARRARA